MSVLRISALIEGGHRKGEHDNFGFYRTSAGIYTLYKLVEPTGTVQEAGYYNYQVVLGSQCSEGLVYAWSERNSDEVGNYETDVPW